MRSGGVHYPNPARRPPQACDERAPLLPELRHDAAIGVELLSKATAGQENQWLPTMGSTASSHVTDNAYRNTDTPAHAGRTAVRRR